MKWLFVLIIIAAAGAWYYNYTQRQAASAAPPPAAVSGPTATPVPTPTPVRIAPAGVFYLLQSLSITSDDGIMGINEGTKVTLVKDTGKSLLVTDGHTQFEVTQDQVTNDMNVADALTKRDRAIDAAVAAGQLKEKQMLIKAQQDEAAREAKEQPSAPPPPPPAPTVNPLSAPAYHN